MADALVIDREHPWPWLEAYTTGAALFFNGRGSDTQALLRCVLSAPTTVLFGKSGLGKTSLLQAGLAPKLKDRQLLPVLVRLDHGEHAPGLSDQMLARLQAEAARAGLELDGTPALPEDGASATARLWELLQDRERRWFDAEGERWQPVFILDQFEEVFTLKPDAAMQRALFDELGDLIEHRVPPEVAARLAVHRATAEDRIDPDRQGARYLISLREDYLPDLEPWADRIPRLGPNRRRLLPMSQAEALQAIGTTGGALVDAADAERIVAFLDQQSQSADPGRPRTQRRERIEPALLSLVCAGLNQHRLEQKAEKLDTRSLDRLGGELLEQFYDRALAALPEKRRDTAADFIETELITLDGTRRPYPERALAKAGLTGADIEALKNKRLLRTENTEQGAYIELVHDRIAVVAAMRAQQSRQRQQVKQAKDRRTAILGLMLAVIGALSLGLIGAWYQWQQAKLAQQIAEDSRRQTESARNALQAKNTELQTALGRAASAEKDANTKAALAAQRAGDAERETARAFKAETKAMVAQADTENQKNKALAELRDATAQRVLSDANDLFSGAKRSSNGIQNILLTLAGHRIAQSSTRPFIQRAGYGGLQRELKRNRRMIWSQTGPFNFSCIAFNPNGNTIATGSSNNTLRLWDTRSGAPVGEPLKGHSKEVVSIAFSPDGKTIVSGSLDSTLRLWDAGSGAPIGEPLNGHTDAVSSVAFSPDGKTIVSGSFDATLRKWDARSGAPIGEPFKGHSDMVQSVAFSPDGQSIVSASSDKSLRLWDVNSGAPLTKPLMGHSERVWSVAFSPDGKTIVSGSFDNTVRRWDARTGAPIGEPLKGHTNLVFSVAFSHDGSTIVSGSADHTLQLWDSHTGQPVGEPIKGHTSGISDAAFSPDDKIIASVSGDHTLRLWSTHNDTPFRQPLKERAIEVSSVVFSPDGKYIISGSKDGILRRFDSRSGKLLGDPIKAHMFEINSIAFSPDGKVFISGSSDQTLRLRDAESGIPIGEPLKGHTQSVLSVAFSPDGKTIASGSFDNTVRLWHARSGAPIGEPLTGHTDWVSSVIFSPNGKHIISGSQDDTLRIWDTNSGTSTSGPFRGDVFGIKNITLSSNGKTLIISGIAGTIQQWKIQDGKIRKSHDWSVDSYCCTAVSSDGNTIATGSGKNVILFDSRSGTPIGDPFEGHTDSVKSVAFSPDGNSIVSGSADGTLRIWPILEAWADQLCAKLPRNMSHKEWRDWVSPDIDYIVQCPGKPIPAD